MSRIQLTNNLFLDEYIPKEWYEFFADKPQILIGLIDRRLVLADQALRNHFGPVTINNWWHGGERNESGIRIPEHKHYSRTSQHSFGRASDKIFRDVLASEVRSYIYKNHLSLGITCIEENVNWVHSDVRWNRDNNLLIVYP